MSKPAKSKSAKKRTNAVLTAQVADTKPAQQIVPLSKGAKADAGSKQSRVIAMLQSPKGYQIAAPSYTEPEL